MAQHRDQTFKWDLSEFPPTRAAGLARLTAFVPFAAGHYAKHRNTDYGPSDGPDKPAGVSGLSPYLRYRLITEAEVIRAVLDHHGLHAAEKFIQEVVWRSYWKGWLEMRPSVWTDYCAERDHWLNRLCEDNTLNTNHTQAITGQTGIDGFDQWAKQLVETGYLHNHARMWFASIWVFTLRLPWTLGADFFLNHLLDGDPASNTLSWRWVCGLQTKGKTYLATRENIERFTEGRFSPSGLASEAGPVTGPEHPKPQALSSLPPPEVLLNQPTLLLLHPDDLCIGVSLQHHPMVKGRVWLSRAGDDNAWPQSDKARCFVEGAVDDLAQAGDRVLHQSDPEAIDRISKELGVAQIVTMAPPVGPAQAWMETCIHTLSTPVTQARRAYDATLWPLATKGFFPFKERVLSSPSLIETMV